MLVFDPFVDLCLSLAWIAIFFARGIPWLVAGLKQDAKVLRTGWKVSALKLNILRKALQVVGQVPVSVFSRYISLDKFLDQRRFVENIAIEGVELLEGALLCRKIRIRARLCLNVTLSGHLTIIGILVKYHSYAPKARIIDKFVRIAVGRERKSNIDFIFLGRLGKIRLR